MLIEFSFGNFRSFKESATLSMLSTNLVSVPDLVEVDERNIFNCAKTKICLLKSAAIYGANASGKSNIIKALRTMRDIVINSSRSGQINDIIQVEPYQLDQISTKEPSGFQVIFLIDGIRYRYGFEATRRKVVTEWLYYVPKSRETKIFEREENNFTMSEKFKLTTKGLEESTRDNALLISVLGQFNNDIAKKIINWFTVISFVQAEVDNASNSPTRSIFADEKNINRISGILDAFGIGISGIDYEEIDMLTDKRFSNMPDYLKDIIKESGNSKSFQIKTKHNQYDADGKIVGQVDFDLERHESDGTKKLFGLLPILLEVSSNGGIAIIDELDSRIHPTITKTILDIFNNSDHRVESQLIFTTHDTNILTKENFRRDQIWFVEKNVRGESSLYSLAEMQARNDSNYDKDYLSGRYGAVPYINVAKAMDI